VLTGHGAREHRNNLLWLAGAIGTIAVIAGIWWLLSLRSEERQALEAYTAPVERTRLRYGERLSAIQERSWLGNAAPMVGLDDARIRPAREIKLAGARAVFAESLKGMIPLTTPAVWVAPEQAGDVRKAWSATLDGKSNVERAVRAGIRVVDAKQVRQQLEAAGLDEEAIEVLTILARHRGGDETSPSARIRAGDLPEAMHIATFSGTKGELLVDRSRRYQVLEKIPYQGRLVRLRGPGWPTDWKILDIRTEKSDF